LEDFICELLSFADGFVANSSTVTEERHGETERGLL
jgi:hypothetical protein